MLNNYNFTKQYYLNTDTCPAVEGIQRYQFNERDQTSFIAISVAANVPCTEIKRKLRSAINAKNRFADNTIEKKYREFKTKQRLSTEDKRCQNTREPTATTQENEDLLNHLMSIQRDWNREELAREMRISTGSVSTLLQRLGYRKLRARWVPHDLTDDDKRNRVEAAQANLNWFRSDARMLGRIIAFDETVWRCYIPPDWDQASQYRRRNERPPTRVSQFREPWSAHLIMAVRQDQIIDFEWLNKNERWTQDRVIQFLNGTIRTYVEQTMPGETPIILMDNAPWHTGARVMTFIREEMKWELLNHPPWSPDFDPLDREIFQRIKRPYKGIRFQDQRHLKSVVAEIVDYLNANKSLTGTSNLPQVWANIVDAKGDYYFN